jgi:hypothetical protein
MVERGLVCGVSSCRCAPVIAGMLVMAGALVTAFIVLCVPCSAFASERQLTGAFVLFADCPLSNPAVRKCFVDETTSGAFTLGKRTVPIDKTITVRGGMTSPNPETREGMILPAEDGKTLSSTGLSVPGGLLGILDTRYLPGSLRGALDETIDDGITAVTLTAQLAQPANPGEISEYNLLIEKRIALRLPLKVKLGNPFLGENCYIGSSASPIMLNLTTGSTNPPSPEEPIHGSSGELNLFEEAEIAVLTGTSLVDNTFTAPSANGCGGSSSTVVDAAIDAQLGLPSPAGENTAILTGNIDVAGVVAVRERVLDAAVGTG